MRSWFREVALLRFQMRGVRLPKSALRVGLESGQNSHAPVQIAQQHEFVGSDDNMQAVADCKDGTIAAGIADAEAVDPTCDPNDVPNCLPQPSSCHHSA